MRLCAHRTLLFSSQKLWKLPETGIDLDQLAVLWTEGAAPTVFFLIDKEKESTLMYIKDW
jgi:hypothetical protein